MIFCLATSLVARISPFPVPQYLRSARVIEIIPWMFPPLIVNGGAGSCSLSFWSLCIANKYVFFIWIEECSICPLAIFSICLPSKHLFAWIWALLNYLLVPAPSQTLRLHHSGEPRRRGFVHHYKNCTTMAFTKRTSLHGNSLELWPIDRQRNWDCMQKYPSTTRKGTSRL